MRTASAAASTTVAGMLTTAQAAAVLGVHERTVRRYLSQGLLAHRRLPGGRYRIPPAAIEELWRASAREPEPAAPLRRARRRSTPPGPPASDLSAPVLAALRARHERQGTTV